MVAPSPLLSDSVLRMKRHIKMGWSMQSPKKAFAALRMHQGHATVRSGSHTGRILNKAAFWAGIPESGSSSPALW